MDARLIALKLFLDELHIPSNTSTFDNRKKIQKAVYLGQFAGADLGYRFGWDKMGPFSPDLARDYYLLSDSLALGYKDYEGMSLKKEKLDKLRTVLPLMEAPRDVALASPEWLELVSSLHFLRKIRAYDEKRAEDVLKNEKPKLSRYVKQAEEELREVESLNFD